MIVPILNSFNLTSIFYNHDLNINTLKFEGEYISIVVNADWFYINKSGYLDKVEYGNKTMRIKIHRKYINTVHFK